VDDEAVGVRRPGGRCDLQAGFGKCLPERGGHADSLVRVDLGEQVDVMSRPVDEPVGDHGAASRERQRVRFGEGEGGLGYLFLKTIE
jgi:hypothetical protein